MFLINYIKDIITDLYFSLILLVPLGFLISIISLCIIDNQVMADELIYNGDISMLQREPSILGTNTNNNYLYLGTYDNPIASNNVVVIDDINLRQIPYFYGALSNNNPIENNSITLKNADINYGYGGYGLGNVKKISNNNINISGGNTRVSNFYGIYAFNLTNATVNNNQITVDNFIITQTGYLYGIIVNNGSDITINNNSLTINNKISNSDAANNVIGISVSASADNVTVQNNSIYINNGSFANLRGVVKLSSTATEAYLNNNYLYISGGGFASSIILASNAALGTANGNIFEISGGYFAYVTYTAAQITISNVNYVAEASNNTLKITGGVFFAATNTQTINSFIIRGGSSVAIANNNIVNINHNGSFGSVYSGNLTACNATACSLEGNKIILNGTATANLVVPANHNLPNSTIIADKNNSVTINGGNTIVRMDFCKAANGTCGNNYLEKNTEESKITTLNRPSKIIFGYSGEANITTLDTHNVYATTDMDTSGHDVTFSGNITGTGLLNKIGAGTLTLVPTSSNSYSGGTSITEGTLSIATDNALGTGGTNTIGGGALRLTDGGTFSKNWTLTDDAANAIDVAEGDEATYAGVLSNSGADPGVFSKTGAGTLVLSGTSHSYTGATTIREGALSIGADSNVGSGDAIIDGGKLLLTSTTGYSRTWILGDSEDNSIEAGDSSGVTFGGILTGDGGFTKTGANDLTLSATNIFTGLVTVGEGALINSGSLASNRLRLLADTTFTNTGTHSLDDGALTVAGENAQYIGNLSATDAAITFEFDSAPSQALLTVTGNADISRSVVRLSAPRAALLDAAVGTAYALMAATGTLTTEGASAEAEVSDMTTSYSLGLLRSASNTLSAVVEHIGAAPTAKAFSEGYVAAMALVTETASLVSDAGVKNAALAAARQPGPSAFMGFDGGWTRYETGSHVDSSSISVLAGVALGPEIDSGKLTLGAFLEYGYGSYDTFNSFPRDASAEGKGDASHAGGGLLARLDFNEGSLGHFYVEGSGRIGSVRNSYTFENVSGYKANSKYFGFHAGAGHVFSLGGGASLDAYAKYFWTTQEGKNVTLTTGELVQFDDVNSSRVRVGGRFSKVMSDSLAPYVGLAWEHEFDGDMAARNSRNHQIDRPTLKGDTGLGELGLSITPSKSGPLTIELGVQGLAGRRRGVSGSAQLKLVF